MLARCYDPIGRSSNSVVSARRTNERRGGGCIRGRAATKGRGTRDLRDGGVSAGVAARYAKRRTDGGTSVRAHDRQLHVGPLIRPSDQIVSGVFEFQPIRARDPSSLCHASNRDTSQDPSLILFHFQSRVSFIRAINSLEQRKRERK